MIYIIGAIILLIIFAVVGGEGGVGCFFFLLIAFVLWRIGMLGFFINMAMKIFRWVTIRVLYYYEKFFGADEELVYLSKGIISLLL